MDHGEGQSQRRDALVVKAFPGHRAAEIAALRRGLRRREGLGAFRVLQRFPVGQARAFLLHVFGIPPLFLGLRSELAEALGLAGRVGGLHGLAGGGVPELHADVEVAVGQAGGQAGEIVGGRIFDGVAELFQDAAEDLGVEVDAGPVEQRDLDRVVAIPARRPGRSDLLRLPRQGPGLPSIVSKSHCEMACLFSFKL